MTMERPMPKLQDPVRLGAFDLASGVSFVPKPYDHSAIVDMLKASFGSFPGPI